MAGYEFEKLELKDAFYIKNISMGDSRGDFTKCFEKAVYKNAGIEFNVYETFVSVSSCNILRGLHFQIHNPQAKLVSVLSGSAWDVIVDLRKNSPTYKKWYSVVLNNTEHNALYIPKGFAHGFVSLEDNTTMLYMCDGPYDKETDTGIRFDDETIGIDWPVDINEVICSERDKGLMSFEEYEKNPMEL